jgi:hypothetical protein
MLSAAATNIISGGCHKQTSSKAQHSLYAMLTWKCEQLMDEHQHCRPCDVSLNTLCIYCQRIYVDADTQLSVPMEQLNQDDHATYSPNSSQPRE